VKISEDKIVPAALGLGHLGMWYENVMTAKHFVVILVVSAPHTQSVLLYSPVILQA